MIILPIMTGKDVSLSVNGRRLAMVESCEISATRELQKIGAYGERTPVGVETGGTEYRILIKCARLFDQALQDGICFEKLSSFTLTLKEPDRSIVYADCVWDGVIWKADLEQGLLKQASALSFQRTVLEEGSDDEQLGEPEQ